PLHTTSAHAGRSHASSLHPDANTQLTCPDPFAVIPLICCVLPSGKFTNRFTAPFAVYPLPLMLKLVPCGPVFGVALNVTELQLAPAVKFVYRTSTCLHSSHFSTSYDLF